MVKKNVKAEFVRDIGEDGLIEKLRARLLPIGPRIIRAIGDDACVAALRPGFAVLATVDMLVEGVHFKASYTPGRLLGRKALAVSLSDIAAMGAAPLFCLVSLAIPQSASIKFIDEFYDGLTELAKKYSVSVAGGNCSKMPGRIVVETTVVGQALPDKVVYRDGARPGDVVYVTGTPGDAALGLKILKKEGISALKGRFGSSVKKHLDPVPRLEVGAKLAESGFVSAMIDVSDGLLIDLERLSAASGVKAEINAALLPISGDMQRYPFASDRARFNTILGGGEDYELVFTARRENVKKIEKLSARFNLPITAIGAISSFDKHGAVTITGSSGRALKNSRSGFLHF